ncbi:hypothetical protein MUS1_03580 [Marinomonas ushuaiensis DSM 15871]|uniref:DUF2489 domain-containing protein n=1 Tax=Marinomonas ushuaiensis DSM 15871 TaxID=1122207 RepID=X7E2M9_9GAMM|nr:DUF2489 domain-containing protein [Marinomonas ushuaiensis]ETX10140.1 hypothetical protein MUS1_03580 [Marinomonas ushuaiensis DSM 15871]
MSLTVFLIFLFVAMGVIAVSTWFIFRQIRLNKVREQRVVDGEARVAAERQKRIDSINVLLKVANTKEINWVEASIRIKNLLDQLGVDLSGHEDISAFYIVTEKTEHIPTHEQWKDLPKEAKVKFRREMGACEKDYVEHLLRARDALSAHSFS